MIATKLPKLGFLHRTFGLCWHSHRVPTKTILTWILSIVAVVLFFLAQAVVQKVEVDTRTTEEVAKRALGGQESAEQTLLYLLNGYTIVAGTDYMSCKLRDRASTLLKDGRLP
jgi:hypothetical protein